MSDERARQILEASAKAYQTPEDRRPLEHSLSLKHRRKEGLNIAVYGYREAFRRGARWADANPKKEEK